MYKDVLSKDELAELLTPNPEDEAEEHRGERAIADHRELAFQYLQETVREMQKEIAQLRSRVEVLEKRQAGSAVRKETAKKAAETPPAPPPSADAGKPGQGAALSRVERHKTRKSKWF